MVKKSSNRAPKEPYVSTLFTSYEKHSSIKLMSSVSAIVPAFNEAERIGAVLAVLAKHPLISEIIVVDDGSDDGTSKIAIPFGAKILRNEQNIGKGASMERGVKAASGDVFFFCDADIVGLTSEMITTILEPVLKGMYDMSVGIRGRIVHTVPGSVSLLPVLGGERAVTRELWNKIPPIYKNRFEIETALNFFSRFHGKGFCYSTFPNLGQVIKETKYGLFVGGMRRASMSTDVALAHARLYSAELLKWWRTRGQAQSAQKKRPN